MFLKKLKQPVAKIEKSLNYLTKRAAVLQVNVKLIEQARHFHQKYPYVYYDCLITIAASVEECDAPVSENW